MVINLTKIGGKYGTKTLGRHLGVGGGVSVLYWFCFGITGIGASKTSILMHEKSGGYVGGGEIFPVKWDARSGCNRLFVFRIFYHGTTVHAKLFVSNSTFF